MTDNLDPDESKWICSCPLHFVPKVLCKAVCWINASAWLEEGPGNHRRVGSCDDEQLERSLFWQHRDSARLMQVNHHENKWGYCLLSDSVWVVPSWAVGRHVEGPRLCCVPPRQCDPAEVSQIFKCSQYSLLINTMHNILHIILLYWCLLQIFYIILISKLFFLIWIYLNILT